jgi:hypothetical protein
MKGLAERPNQFFRKLQLSLGRLLKIRKEGGNGGWFWVIGIPLLCECLRPFAWDLYGREGSEKLGLSLVSEQRFHHLL